MTFGRQWSYHTITGRLQIQTRASSQTFWVARAFFRMAPSADGERARQLANTLLGAKDGGRHHQECASALTSLRRQIRCCALATTISWFSELIDRQLPYKYLDTYAISHQPSATQAQRRFVRRKLVNTNVRFR